MAKYEAHITIDKEYSSTLKVKYGQLIADWYYSAIDDDPIMGQHPYCYLTGWDTDPDNLFARMERVVSILKEQYRIPVLRTKIERIIFDSKTGVDELRHYDTAS